MSGQSQNPKKEAIVPRFKNVQFVSISPLDRLLNQRALDDEVKVQVSCRSRNGAGEANKDYDITMKKAQINKETCWDKSIPKENESCIKEDNQQLECDAGEPYVVELFDLRAQKMQNLATPPTLGDFTVTREMMECLPDDTLKIHFEYGKRQELAGAVACFDHTEYIRTGKKNGVTYNNVEDEIPFTILNICNKNTVDRRRCFLYSYQITLHVQDSRDINLQLPLIQPRIYAKVFFKSLKKKMIVLPGDQLKARFVTDYTDQEAVRVQPEIHSPQMPSPLKERYQLTGGAIRLPCDDQKVADSLVCTNFEAHCTEPRDKLFFSLQGAGDIFMIDSECQDFLKDYVAWDAIQNQLEQDFSKFKSAYQVAGGAIQKYNMDKGITFKNKFGVDQTEDDWFEFEYQIWWRMHSNEPRCFAGDHMTSQIPQCDLECGDQQCLLMGPPEPHKDNRLLSAETSPADSIRKRFLQELAGNDVSAPKYYDKSPTLKRSIEQIVKQDLPLTIPTRPLNPEMYVVPERLLQIYLSNYQGATTSSGARRVGLIELESEVEEGKAVPINLSASFEQLNDTQYYYNVTDKVKLDNSPPAAIQITELPKNGKILTQKLEGGTKELKVGDFITTEAMSEFQYDQGEQPCSKDNQDNCKDSFAYVTYSSWVGQGPESEAVISLKPVAAGEGTQQNQKVMKAQEQKATAAIAPPSLAQAQIEPKAELQSVQMPQMVAAEDMELVQGAGMAGLDGICSNQYPSALVNFLTIVIVLLITAIAGIVSYYFYTKRQGVSKKSTSDEKEFYHIKESEQADKAQQDNVAE